MALIVSNIQAEEAFPWLKVETVEVVVVESETGAVSYSGATVPAH